MCVLSRCVGAVVVTILCQALCTACAPAVSFPMVHPGLPGVGRDIGFEFGTVDFEVNLDLVDQKETAAVRKKNASAQGAPSDAELYGPVVEREMRRMVAAGPAVRILSEATHTMDLSAKFYARDTAAVKKEEIKIDNRVIDVKETHVVDRIYELTLRYELRSALTGSVIGAGRQERVRTVSGSGKSVDDAMRRFESWEINLEYLVNQAVSRVAAEILPRQEIVTRKLREGGTPELRESVALAVKEGLDRAWPLWQGLLSGIEKLPQQDRAALLYDAAVYHESKDEVAEALAVFEQCFATAPDPWCREGRERMQAREQELAQMR